MRAVRNTEHGIQVLEVPEPEGDGPIVYVRAGSICGSDLHMVNFGPIEFTLGHEVAGVLEDGTRVAVDPASGCGTCDQCARGATHLCRNGFEHLLGVGAHGGFASAVAVPGHKLVTLPESLRIEDACLVEPIGVAVHSVRLSGMGGGERVAVVGAGSIGLAAVAAARPLADEVGITARHDHQIAAGERLGAHAATGEYDVVFEAAGTESALSTAAELCRPNGTIVFLSTHWEPVAIPSLAAMMKELGFQWSYCTSAHEGGHDLDDSAALLAADPEIANTLITHRFPLDDAAEAFRVAADRASGAIKVVLEP
ncbi:MAG: Zn-dependent alcohol dehydrogenase [Acidimicrobiia bacterium]|nr:Zn-dependent alcohol dehydrogenase [Acidimicrobiia bacterium]